MKVRYILSVLIGLTLCSLSTLTHARSNAYICKILQIMEMGNDGTMQKHNGVWVSTLGKTFSVNVNTGEMIGFPFTTDGWLGGVKVLDRGGNVSSYKALVLSGGPFISARYIHIAEYKDAASKPFWGNGDDAVIFSGLCENM